MSVAQVSDQGRGTGGPVVPVRHNHRGAACSGLAGLPGRRPWRWHGATVQNGVQPVRPNTILGMRTVYEAAGGQDGMLRLAGPGTAG
jgi:hypothetical protein